MRIVVLCFASTRDAVGVPRLDLEVAEEATVESVLAALAERHPELQPALPSLRCAVNEEFAGGGTRLHPGDTLALIPPMSGG